MTGAGRARGGQGGSAKGRPPEPPAPPVTVPAACGSCGSPSLTRLPMVLADGTDVVFVSCHACEAKAWLRTGADGDLTPMPIDTVLERSAKKR